MKSEMSCLYDLTMQFYLCLKSANLYTSSPTYLKNSLQSQWIFTEMAFNKISMRGNHV